VWWSASEGATKDAPAESGARVSCSSLPRSCRAGSGRTCEVVLLISVAHVGSALLERTHDAVAHEHRVLALLRVPDQMRAAEQRRASHGEQDQEQSGRRAAGQRLRPAAGPRIRPRRARSAWLSASRRCACCRSLLTLMYRILQTSEIGQASPPQAGELEGRGSVRSTSGAHSCASDRRLLFVTRKVCWDGEARLRSVRRSCEAAAATASRRPSGRSLLLVLVPAAHRFLRLRGVLQSTMKGSSGFSYRTDERVAGHSKVKRRSGPHPLTARASSLTDKPSCLRL